MSLLNIVKQINNFIVIEIAALAILTFSCSVDYFLPVYITDITQKGLVVTRLLFCARPDVTYAEKWIIFRSSIWVSYLQYNQTASLLKGH